MNRADRRPAPFYPSARPRSHGPRSWRPAAGPACPRSARPKRSPNADGWQPEGPRASKAREDGPSSSATIPVPAIHPPRPTGAASSRITSDAAGCPEAAARSISDHPSAEVSSSSRPSRLGRRWCCTVRTIRGCRVACGPRRRGPRCRRRDPTWPRRGVQKQYRPKIATKMISRPGRYRNPLIGPHRHLPAKGKVTKLVHPSVAKASRGGLFCLPTNMTMSPALPLRAPVRDDGKVKS